MDLYRLRGGLDLHVLDIPSVLETCVCLVEWPDRLGRAMPLNRLGKGSRFNSRETQYVNLARPKV